MPTLPTTRRAAELLGAKQYNTGKPCRSGHHAPRNTCDGYCIECRRIRDALRRKQQPKR